MSFMVVRVDKLKDNSIFAFRLVDLESLQSADISIKDIIAKMKSGDIDIENIKITTDDKVEGKDYPLTKYPTVVFNSIEDVEKNQNYDIEGTTFINATILGRYNETNVDIYMCANHDGEIDQLSAGDILYLNKLTGLDITNGTIDGDNIKGNFRQLSDFSTYHNDIEEHKKKFEEFKQKTLAQYAINTQKVKAEEQSRLDRNAKMLDRYNPGANANIEVQVGNEKIYVDAEVKKQLEYAKLTHPNYVEANKNGVVDPKTVDDTTSAIARTSKSGHLSLEEKMVLASTTLKYIDPFVYATYLSLDKIYLRNPEGGITTMGVSDDKLYIVIDKVNSIPLPQISYILLHEVYHIIMLHQARRKSRDPFVWNIACDLFVNKTIDVNYGCKPGTPVQKMMYRNVAPIGLEFHANCNDEEIYSSLFVDDLDTTKETPENIYNTLMQENRQKLEKIGNNENSSDDTSQSGNGSGGNGTNQSQDNQNEDGNSSNNNQNSNKNSNKKSSKDEKGNGNSNGSNDNKLTYKGNPIMDLPNKRTGDMVEDSDSKSHGQDSQSKESWARGFVNKVLQRAQALGYSKDGSPLLREAAKSGAERAPSWYAKLKSYFLKYGSKQRGYKEIDHKSRALGVYLPGKYPKNLDAMDKVYFCIDVSGSIDDDDLSDMFGMLMGIMNRVNRQSSRGTALKGYTMFWSTSVDGPYEFNNKDELIKIRNRQYNSTGGTDVNCLFNWFNNRKKCNVKLRPNLIIIVTDGFFDSVTEDIPKDAYGKPCNVLWVITGEDYKEFDAPFGKVFPLEQEY